MKDNIPTSHFELFYKLAQYCSFTSTAKALGISKAAVSQSIKALENKLEINLINRTTRSLSLTHEGRLLYEDCKKLQNTINNIKETVESFHKRPSGTLHISSNPFFANNTLLQIIKEYRDKFPDVSIDIDVEERIPNFKNENIDIVFGVNWQAPDDIIARKIGNTRYVLCTSPEYIKHNGKPNSLSDLCSHNHILHKSRMTELVSLRDDISFDGDFPKLLSNNIMFMKECVLQGLGIGQFHDYVVSEHIKNGELIELIPHAFKSEESIYIYYQKDKFVQPKVKEFIAIALECCKHTTGL